CGFNSFSFFNNMCRNKCNTHRHRSIYLFLDRRSQQRNSLCAGINNYLYSNWNRCEWLCQYINGKIVFEKKLFSLSAIRFGSEYNYSNEKTTFTQYNGNIFPQTVKENIFSG